MRRGSSYVARKTPFISSASRIAAFAGEFVSILQQSGIMYTSPMNNGCQFKPPKPSVFTLVNSVFRDRRRPWMRENASRASGRVRPLPARAPRRNLRSGQPVGARIRGFRVRLVELRCVEIFAAVRFRFLREAMSANASGHAVENLTLRICLALASWVRNYPAV
jgi:hypothetical protein